ncbi:MAG: tRNA dihydrouridine synthase DusB [Desulfitobacteriaceae bacterium]|nr:tRNA dihydrouridine synthase DusB [Desulfitobacteriaceae bacterium]MDD4752437.1 tRNA dihydrouridine synthase DusB [Desulfitobacteriaceae bacterium]
MEINKIKLENSVITAPMAGITDKAFREILKSMGAAMVCTEMVSDKALIYANKKTFELLDIEGEEYPICVQLFGSEPDVMAKAAKIISSKGAHVLDINMGCPAPKIVRNGEGSALMLKPKLAQEIVDAVVQAVSIPVTVKMRKGWDVNSVNAVEVARLVEEAGAAAITVHGRARDQFYTGQADWGIIADVKNAVSIPVVGNGDIWNPEDGQKIMAETGCDAVMVGRGMLGNPWLVKRTVEALTNSDLSKVPTLDERLTMAERHLDRVVELKGEITGVRQMRKHLAWYIKGLRDAARVRTEINRLTQKQEINELFLRYRKILENDR